MPNKAKYYLGLYILTDPELLFRSSGEDSLTSTIQYSIEHPEINPIEHPLYGPITFYQQCL